MKSNKTWMANEAYQWLELKGTVIATGGCFFTNAGINDDVK